MRVSLPGGARGYYYDRAPTPQVFEFQGGAVAPHTDTSRFGYTVPAGRKAFIVHLVATISRATVAAPVGSYGAHFGGLGANLAWLRTRKNTVDAAEVLALPTSLTLNAGQVLSGLTFDGSTGGTVDYQINAALVEFDA